MTNNKVMKIWHETLEKTCHCYADDNGNRPCDYGYLCNKCEADWVEEVYRKALAEAEEPPKKKKFTVIVHDIATYNDIEAESEDEAIEQALEWWDERQPRWKVVEENENK